MMRYWGNNMMNDWGSWCGGGSGGYFGPFLSLIFWVVVIVAIVFLIKWLAKSHSGSGNKPLEILKERYAKGEITKEEFEAKKKDMGA